MWVSVSPVSAGGDRTSPAPTPALVTGVKLISARIPSSPPQPIPGPPSSAKTAHQLYPRVPGRTFIFLITFMREISIQNTPCHFQPFGVGQIMFSFSKVFLIQIIIFFTVHTHKSFNSSN